MNSGYVRRSGVPMEAQLEYAISPVPYETKEAIDIDIFSDHKPTSVTIGSESTYSNPSFISSLLGVRYLRDFVGHFYGFIPRRTTAPRNRMQNVYFYIKLIHTTAETFVVRLVKTGYKILK